jgi:dUTP pyrophosphatase
MGGVARFMHVSARQFCGDWRDAFGEGDVPGLPPLPRRATALSAGYDFFAPAAFSLEPGETIRIPTGVRARIDGGWVLMLFPRSGLGFKYRLRLDNTVGVVDADYFGAKNEGHIFVKLTNCGGAPLSVATGEAFCQGVFLPYGTAEEEDVLERRTGGFGSTDR